MRTRTRWLLGGALALALATSVVAQVGTLVQTSISGNEVWKAAQGPGGPEQFLGVNQVRNGAGLIVIPSVSGAATTQATTSGSTYYWVGTAPTTWTVTTPATPFDGEIISLATDTTLTTMVTLTANTGQSLNTTFSNQTITAKTSVEFQYSAATTKWYELR